MGSGCSHDPVVDAFMAFLEKRIAMGDTERKETQMAIKGNNLKAEMARREMGSKDLGEKLGIGSYAVESYCDDMATMPAVILYRAASLFGCSTDWLLGISNERTVQSPTRTMPW